MLLCICGCRKKHTAKKNVCTLKRTDGRTNQEKGNRIKSRRLYVCMKHTSTNNNNNTVSMLFECVELHLMCMLFGRAHCVPWQQKATRHTRTQLKPTKQYKYMRRVSEVNKKSIQSHPCMARIRYTERNSVCVFLLLFVRCIFVNTTQTIVAMSLSIAYVSLNRIKMAIYKRNNREKKTVGFLYVSSFSSFIFSLFISLTLSAPLACAVITLLFSLVSLSAVFFSALARSVGFFFHSPLISRWK